LLRCCCYRQTEIKFIKHLDAHVGQQHSTSTLRDIELLGATRSSGIASREDWPKDAHDRRSPMTGATTPCGQRYPRFSIAILLPLDKRGFVLTPSEKILARESQTERTFRAFTDIVPRGLDEAI